ncbi:4Fe-4S dicluster domain-containing protein [Limnochorda pilosa]|uniref:4Fe-4S ferredoxin-type domain-containing protein n=1 Tax=Limnochorda pilosa TaxID=1555112 RepID=A0A0K2SGK0_LIMPI|nr:4Fe-4S dicluster domain-containing protein [Limnochorda pilosa]BAS26238.1 hypothetical protein LIP_0381 [Limnochorda pilosa]
MPVAAIEEAAERLAGLEGSALRVRPRQCLNLRHLRAGCSACAEACPTKAIRWSPRLRVEPFDCAQCGACATACPAGALEVRDSVWCRRLAQISRAVAGTGRVLFACPLHLRRDRSLRRRTDVVEVPCVGAIQPWEIVAAVAFGAASVLLLEARCSRCTYRVAHGRAVRTVEEAQSLLAAWGRREEVRLGSEPPASTEAGSAFRALAGLLPQKGRSADEELARRGLEPQEIGGDTTQPQDPGEGLERWIPSSHRKLLFFLHRLGEPAADRVAPNAPLAHVEVAPDCTGCGMCAYFCPTGALRKRETAGKTELAFRAQECTNCGFCTRICYQGAIRTTEARPGAVLSGEEQVLWSGRPSTPQERLARRLV